MPVSNPIQEIRSMRILTSFGFDASADRPWAGQRYGRVVPKGATSRVVPTAVTADSEGVP
jgi:hypothetical protein